MHEQVKDILDRVRSEPPNILQSLLALQEQLGHVAADMVPVIAKSLGVTTAEVAGVLSYYPDLRSSAPGRHIIRVCMGSPVTPTVAGGCCVTCRNACEPMFMRRCREDGSRSTPCPAQVIVRCPPRSSSIATCTVVCCRLSSTVCSKDSNSRVPQIMRSVPDSWLAGRVRRYSLSG